MGWKMRQKRYGAAGGEELGKVVIRLADDA